MFLATILYLVSSSTIFTARKRSLRRLCFYTCLSFCPQGGACSGGCLVRGVSALGGVCSGGCLLWGGGLLQGVPGPGEWGACSGGGRAGVPDLGVSARGVSVLVGVCSRRGVCSRGCLLQGVVSQHALRQTPLGPGTPRSSACGEIRSTSGRYASYWNAILLCIGFRHDDPCFPYTNSFSFPMIQKNV